MPKLVWPGFALVSARVEECFDMDGMMFDRLARALAASASRRRLFGLVSGLALADLMASLGAEESAARHKRHGRRARHRPGKHKDNRKGKRKGSANDRFDECVSLLTSRLCVGITRNGGGSCQPNTNLQNIDLHGCFLTDSILDGVIFAGSEGQFPANLGSANLVGASLRGAQMRKVNLTNANLKGAHLDGARMDGANMRKAFLQNAVLDQAIMIAVTFSGEAQLASFIQTDLRNAVLAESRLEGANFQDADLRGVRWTRAICPDGNYTAVGADTCCGQLNGHTTPNCG